MKNKKTILITGGCGIIGSGILKGLISYGHNVILVDKNSKKLKEISKTIPSKQHITIEANILKKTDIDFCIKKGLEKFKYIDTAIHAAYPKSNGWGTKFEDLKEDFLKEDIN